MRVLFMQRQNYFWAQLVGAPLAHCKSRRDSSLFRHWSLLISFLSRKGRSLSSTAESFKAAFNWALRRATLQAVAMEPQFWALSHRVYQDTAERKTLFRENCLEAEESIHGSRICMGCGSWPQTSRSILTLAGLFMLDCIWCRQLI